MITKGRSLQLASLLMLLFPSLVHATPYYGAQFSSILIAKEPEDMRGYQLMLNYDPGNLSWQPFSLYFDAGFSHFWINNQPHHRMINIYSAAPVLRYHLPCAHYLSPYIDFSIGLAYLNRTHLDNRNLGIHFSFQDRIQLGALFGPQERFSIGLSAIHYSNAHLSSHNSGLTALLVFDIGYRIS